VYVHKSLSSRENKIQIALDALAIIKERGPYHPTSYPPVGGFKKYQSLPLEARTKDILAKVIHEVGILREPTAECLDETIAEGGTLFAQYDDGAFKVYLADKCSESMVKTARDFLPAGHDS
jgi:hypothetical protein